MNILGINAFHGDASAALVKDGVLVGGDRGGAAQSAQALRRVSRRWPSRRCWPSAGVAPSELDHVAVSRDPKANLHKKILFAIQKRPSFTKLVKDRLANVAKVRGVDESLAAALGVDRSALRAKFHAVEHHKSHISSAFFISPFEEAACLSIDGFGDFVSTMRGVGRGSQAGRSSTAIEFPHSAGLFYTAITQFLGFHRYGEEWKMMGLAPYGKPTYVEKLRQVIHPTDGGRFELNLDYFRHHSEGVEMTWDDGSPQIGPGVLAQARRAARARARSRGSRLLRQVGRHRAQRAGGLRGDLLPRRSTTCSSRTGLDKLSLAGGCALNSVANGKIFERTTFRELFVQPGRRRRRHRDRRRVLRRARGAGPPAPVRHARRLHRARVRRRARSRRRSSAARGNGWDASIDVRRLDDADLYRQVAQAVAAGKVVGWFQGRMEFGPARARQPLDRRRSAARRHEGHPQHADQAPRDLPAVRAQRPRGEGRRDLRTQRAVAVHADGLQGQGRTSGARIPAVTHVDDTGRLQTVSAATNPALSRADHRVRAPDRRAAGAQHQLQRARADRGDAR